MNLLPGEHYKSVQGGDIYYYTNPSNPYPFTQEQLAAIKSYEFSNLICVNSGLDSVAKRWLLVENQTKNPKVPCINFPQIDLSAWKE
jgi:hypothetical protein